MNKNPSQSQIEQDIKKNKIKEGWVVKQSRHLKQWKERWMVLTRTNIYSFSQKGVYKNPTEILSLDTTLTVKSYYKMQYEKPHIFRVETPDIHLYLSPKTSEEKWAWMTAIEKMLNRVFTPQEKPDTSERILETLKMANTMRETLNNNSTGNTANLGRVSFLQESEKTADPSVKDGMKEVLENMKLQISNQIYSIEIKSPKINGTAIQLPTAQNDQKMLQVQKVVYIDNNSEGNKGYLELIFKDLMQTKVNNPKPMVDFIVFILISRLEKYYQTILSFLMSAETQRFFAEIFLIMLNQETDESKLNTYVQFMTILYENADQYFYSSDVKVLIDIILREMELNRSQFNQYLLMIFLKTISVKLWWKKLSHRIDELKMMVKELQSISGPENQKLAKQLLDSL